MNGLNGVATPLAQMPVVLVIALIFSLAGLLHMLLTRRNRAVSLGPSLGMVGATLASWVPVVIFGASSFYFLYSLAAVF
jgi:hypothetical protein